MRLVCGRCGHPAEVTVAGDGQPVGFESELTATAMLEWLAYARAALASGEPGVVVGTCTGCRAPLAVGDRVEVALPCPHCGETARGPAADVLVDQRTEPWTHVTGGEADVEYRLVMLEDVRGVAAGCAACGAPTPPADPSNRCPSCRAVAWMARGQGRLQLGVRVDGQRDRKPFKALVPVVTGEAMLNADARHGTRARSGRSLAGATAIGCASAIAALVLLIAAAAIAAHFAHC
jgi:hypothetical protein